MGHYSNYQKRVAYDGAHMVFADADAFKGVAIHYHAYGADSLIAARAAFESGAWHFAFWATQADTCLLAAAIASMPKHVVRACDKARDAGHVSQARRVWGRLLRAQKRRVKRAFNRHYAEQGWYNA